MKRFIYKKIGEGLVVGIDGDDFDSHSANVRVWDSANTEHIWDIPRQQLVDSETVKVLWFRDNGDLAYTGLESFENVDSELCPVCNGESLPMGALGATQYYRCIQCGWTFSA